MLAHRTDIQTQTEIEPWAIAQRQTCLPCLFPAPANHPAFHPHPHPLRSPSESPPPNSHSTSPTQPAPHPRDRPNLYQDVVQLFEFTRQQNMKSDARVFAQSVRSHWGIENQLPWVLDVSFQEDNLRGCLGYSAENLAVVRHLALNLLTHESTAKGGIHAKRQWAGWNNNYLSLVLNSLSP